MNERNLIDPDDLDFTDYCTDPDCLDPYCYDSYDDAGQATTEYALVLLGAALVALLLVGWATAGGGAGKIGGLLDRVFDAISSKF
jgi:Flp pilus assembly pilin Flp